MIISLTSIRRDHEAKARFANPAKIDDSYNSSLFLVSTGLYCIVGSTPCSQ
jgi:hypothetical protein